MSSRKAQAALNANGSAILVIIITALIVLYILFLPPQDRAELLGESVPKNGLDGGGQDKYAPSAKLLDENVGRVDYWSSGDRLHDLPSFAISTRTEGGVLKSLGSLYVRSSVFDSTVENVTFRIDPGMTSNARLSFNVGRQADGRLIVLLNGNVVLNQDLEAGSSHFVDLESDQLEAFNVLTVGVSSPGWAFWQLNEYQLSTIQITGNVKDVSGAQASQTFILSEEEFEGLERAKLRFYADCEQRDVGRLTIRVNGRSVFSGLGDCGVLNTVELDRRSLDWGENEVSFQTEQGAYLITNVQVRTELEEPVFPIYYFDMDEVYFARLIDGDEVCGLPDGVCPDDCSSDLDKDCCFAEDDEFFWCDVPTAQTNDRCVSFVTASTCARCESGYEDSRGYAPAACEGLCGDDKDGDCPLGCSRFLDRDCCFEDYDGNYWCDDVPVGRPLSAVCRAGVEPDERSGCPGRYYDEDGRRLSFSDDDDEVGERLKSAYEVVMELTFPNRDLKSATILVNGREVGLETYDYEWSRVISDHVRSGTNSVQIVPGRSIDVASLVVRVRRS